MACKEFSYWVLSREQMAGQKFVEGLCQIENGKVEYQTSIYLVLC